MDTQEMTTIRAGTPAPLDDAADLDTQPGYVPEVSEEDFEEVVRGALEAVGGALLFKMKVGAGDEAHHAAAAAVGIGDNRQYLLMTLPARGGQLRVETTAHSASPLAQIAESYAGLMDVLKAVA